MHISVWFICNTFPIVFSSQFGAYDFVGKHRILHQNHVLYTRLESYVSYGEFRFALTLFSVFFVEIVGIAHFLH